MGSKEARSPPGSPETLKLHMPLFFPPTYTKGITISSYYSVMTGKLTQFKTQRKILNSEFHFLQDRNVTLILFSFQVMIKLKYPELIKTIKVSSVELIAQ